MSREVQCDRASDWNQLGIGHNYRVTATNLPCVPEPDLLVEVPTDNLTPAKINGNAWGKCDQNYKTITEAVTPRTDVGLDFPALTETAAPVRDDGITYTLTYTLHYGHSGRESVSHSEINRQESFGWFVDSVLWVFEQVLTSSNCTSSLDWARNSCIGWLGRKFRSSRK